MFIYALSQDGGIGKHSLPPHTTTAKITTKQKTTITQNHQKTELYRNLKTKELKKSHAFRQGGGAETWNGCSYTHICGG